MQYRDKMLTQKLCKVYENSLCYILNFFCKSKTVLKTNARKEKMFLILSTPLVNRMLRSLEASETTKQKEAQSVNHHTGILQERCLKMCNGTRHYYISMK